MEVDRSLLLEGDQLQQLATYLLESSEQCPENLLDAESHPNNRTLVTFADLIYTKKNPGERDAAYGLRMLSGELYANGWRCLITANNAISSNGYFGAAFYHRGQQQVVVAHRGTDLTCIGALYTDLAGICLTDYTPCMNSAVTFVDCIRQVINSANSQHNRHYTLTITGHSLGAWLAQITTFSAKYLAIYRLDSQILFENKPEVGIHAKTVGFDSPGVRDMLDRVLDDYYDRYKMNAPHLEGLDIILYLSAPNHINTCGEHIGRIYRIRNDISNFTWFDTNTLKYTLTTHRMDNFINAFKKDNCIFDEVLDWAKNKKEFNDLFDVLQWDNNYHVHLNTTDNRILLENFQRYQVMERNHSENVNHVGSFRVFSVVELQMLSRMHVLQEQKSELKTLNEFIEKNNLKVESSKLLPNFELDYYKRTITCESGESLAELCRRLKQLMRWLKPQFTEAVEKQIKVFNRAADLFYYEEGQSYLDSLPKCWLDFTDSVGFRDFLVSGAQRVLCLVTSSKDVVFQMCRLWNILRQMKKTVNSSDGFIKYFSKNLYAFVEWSQFKKFSKIYGFPIEKGFLMVVDCTSFSNSTENEALFTELFDHTYSNSMKTVFIMSQSIEVPYSTKFYKTVKSAGIVNFSDLTPDSQNKIFNRGNFITIREKKYSFERFLGEDRLVCDISHILSSENLINFATIENYTINIEDTRPTLSDIQMPFFKLNIKTSMKFFVNCVKSVNTANRQPIKVVMSGLNREDMETGADWHQLKGMDIILAEGDAQIPFRDACNKNQDKCIYLCEVLGRDVYCKEVFNRHFYLDRKFLHRAYINVEEFAETEHADDLFVINSETNKKLLVKLIEKCIKKKAFTDNILIVPTEEEVNVIQKYFNKRIHFVKICQSEESYKLEWRYSHGSVESLLHFMSTDSREPINETDLSKTERNLTIITDEPGMGKTTTLSSLSRLMDSPWVIYIELKHFQGHIGDKLSGTLTHKRVANFLLSGCGSQADELLKFLLESKLNSKRVVLMLDGFDELEDYVKDKDKKSAKQKIIKLLTFLKNIPTVQIFLTARKYLKTSLEEELCNLCTSFVPFDKEEQLKFLIVIWRSCLSLELGDCGEKEEGRLKEYAREVLRQAKEVLGPDTECIMGVPLQLRMLAEVFRPTSDQLLHSLEVLLKQISVESISNLYKKFITLKYEIYLEDKTTLGAATDELIIEIVTESINIMHCKLGFRTFFHNFYVKHFDAIEDRWLNKLNRIGLVQTKGDGDFQFVHRTYAEYCCAQMVVHWLNQPILHYRYELFKEILFPRILLHPDSKIIRMFINLLLNETKMSETSLELNVKCINQLWNEDSSIFRNQLHQTVLHIAVLENNLHIATLLLSGLKIESAQEAFVSLLQQYDQNNNTAINFLNISMKHNICEDELVLDSTITNILQYIGVCSDETKVNIFLAILFNRKQLKSDENAEKFFFERLFDYHILVNKESQVSTEEEPIIKINLFYRFLTNCISCTSRIFDKVKEVQLVIKPFREAVENDNVKLLKKLLWEQLVNNVERYCFLLMKLEDQNKKTFLHIAIDRGHLDIVKILVEQTVVPFIELMARRDGGERTPFHTAAVRGRLNIIKYLVERGADINTCCGCGKSVLMYAALGGELPTVEYLVERGADIHYTDVLGRTVLHHAAVKGQPPLVEFFLQQGVDPDKVDREGRTALTMASQYEEWDVARLLLERGVDVNADGGRALSYAIVYGEWSIVDVLVNKGTSVKESKIWRTKLFEFKEKYPNYEFKK